jgi:hypothetical protein
MERITAKNIALFFRPRNKNGSGGSSPANSYFGGKQSHKSRCIATHGSMCVDVQRVMPEIRKELQFPCSNRKLQALILTAAARKRTHDAMRVVCRFADERSFRPYIHVPYCRRLAYIGETSVMYRKRLKQKYLGGCSFVYPAAAAAIRRMCTTDGSKEETYEVPVHVKVR